MLSVVVENRNRSYLTALLVNIEVVGNFLGKFSCKISKTRLLTFDFAFAFGDDGLDMFVVEVEVIPLGYLLVLKLNFKLLFHPSKLLLII